MNSHMTSNCTLFFSDKLARSNTNSIYLDNSNTAAVLASSARYVVCVCVLFCIRPIHWSNRSSIIDGCFCNCPTLPLTHSLVRLLLVLLLDDDDNCQNDDEEWWDGGKREVRAHTRNERDRWREVELEAKMR